MIKKQACEGGCHCGTVRFEIMIPDTLEVCSCNCSICAMSGYIHLTIARDDFKLISGESSLSEYRFNSGVASHLFCEKCGIKSFYVPRSHPDSFSVNLNCVKLPKGVVVKRQDFDGQNWEDNVDEIRDIVN